MEPNLVGTLITKTSPENARYVLSALAQCEATIVAIVVSLSLVAVQLSASYFPRLVSVFKKTFSFWFTITLYVFSIIVSLTALKEIGYKNTEVLVGISYILDVICFFALIPYTLKIIDLMKPETVIYDAIKSIKKSKDPNKIKREILNIFTIIAGSLSRYDCETAVNGLRIIKNEVLNFLDGDAKFNIYWQINRISGLLVNCGDEEVIIESLLSIIEKITKTAIQKDLAWIGEIVWFLETFGKALINSNNERASVVLLCYLESIWKEYIKTGRKWCIEHTPVAIGEILKGAIKKRMETVEAQSRELLKKLKMTVKILI